MESFAKHIPGKYETGVLRRCEIKIADNKDDETCENHSWYQA